MKLRWKRTQLLFEDRVTHGAVPGVRYPLESELKVPEGLSRY